MGNRQQTVGIGQGRSDGFAAGSCSHKSNKIFGGTILQYSGSNMVSKDFGFDSLINAKVDDGFGNPEVGGADTLVEPEYTASPVNLFGNL